jgi:hypothetical protein
MDPIGLGFENYDGVGLWRTSENGKPIDATGDLLATDVDGKFVGVPALGARLAGSGRVAGCVVTEWFRYAFGRDEADGDACTHQQLQARFAMTGGDLRDLVLGLPHRPIPSCSATRRRRRCAMRSLTLSHAACCAARATWPSRCRCSRRCCRAGARTPPRPSACWSGSRAAATWPTRASGARPAPSATSRCRRSWRRWRRTRTAW